MYGSNVGLKGLLQLMLTICSVVLSRDPKRLVQGIVKLNNFHIQGVPRNMTIARRLESRLWYLNLFVTFSLLSTLTCMILETIIT